MTGPPMPGPPAGRGLLDDKVVVVTAAAGAGIGSGPPNSDFIQPKKPGLGAGESARGIAAAGSRCGAATGAAGSSRGSRTGAGCIGAIAVTAGRSGTLSCDLVSACTSSLRGEVRW